MTDIIDSICIPEYRSKVVDNFNEEYDWDYLEKPCFRYKGRKPYDIFKNKAGETCIKNSSYSGIIQLENARIHFSTKVKTNLFYMLSFLKSEGAFLYDIETPIKFKSGANFFDIIGRLFLNELEEIIKGGLLKKYVKKHENVGFLKGKLHIKGQIQNDINNTTKLSCIYNDLTVNNRENQIVLKALIHLISMIRFNTRLIKDLKSYEYRLKDFVEIVDVSPNDCDKVHFNRLNEHYNSIIKFSKLILEENFIRSTQKGKSMGFNFIVNMNKVYEDFITEMIKEVVKDDPDFKNYCVVSQFPFDSLVTEKNIITKPDIIIKDKTTGEYPFIFDAKYKKDESNADFYQMIAYSLAIPESQNCCLIYPESEVEKRKEYTVVRDISNKESKTVKLHVRSISLFENENETFESFIKRIKTNQIKPLIKSLNDSIT